MLITSGLTIFGLTLGAFHSAQAASRKAPPESYLVELELTKPFGVDGDGFPRYRAKDQSGPLGDSEVSLRCDNGYDGPHVWQLRELMVPDANATETLRPGPEPRVRERGHHFKFRSSEECDRAQPTVAVEGARCTLIVKLTAPDRAEFVSATCVP